jgi:hypothetical protein
MRFYDLSVADPDTGKVIWHYSSGTPSGTFNPNALQIEFDLTVYDYTAASGAWVQVWGIPLTDIRDSKKFNGKTLTFLGGMLKGLPLANPAQQGVLLQGTVFQAIGNWQGVNMTLDFYVQALMQTSTTGNQAPQTPITLATAFPSVKQDIKISPNLILGYDEQAFFQNLSQLAAFCKGASQNIINTGGYDGVRITCQNNTFVVRDGTVLPPTKKAIAFNDLVGQITLGDPGTVIVTCVLRGDLTTGDLITLPPGQVITTSASYAAFRQGSVFTGDYRIISLRHVGNFRQAQAESWVTVITAVGPLTGT